jgi:lysozyme
MVDPILQAQIERDEGLSLTAYPDPLSGGEPYTVGWGCTGPDIGPTTVWTQEQAVAALQERLEANQTALLTALPWVAQLTPPRQRVLSNMQYNMGLNGLLGFRHMLAACQAGQYSQAAEQMLSSHWANQVPQRATRLAEQMESGVDQ